MRWETRQGILSLKRWKREKKKTPRKIVGHERERKGKKKEERKERRCEMK